MKLATATGTVHYSLRSLSTYQELYDGSTFDVYIEKVSGNYPDEYEISSTSLVFNRIRCYNQTKTIIYFGDWFRTNHIRQQFNAGEVHATLDDVSSDIANLTNDTVTATVEYAGSPENAALNFRSSTMDLWINWKTPSDDSGDSGDEGDEGDDGGDSGDEGGEDSGDEEEDEYENPNYSGDGGAYTISVTPAHKSRLLFSELEAGKKFTIKSGIPSTAYVDLNLYVYEVFNLSEDNSQYINNPIYYKLSSTDEYKLFPEDGLCIKTNPKDGELSKIPSTIYFKTLNPINAKQTFSIAIDGQVNDDDQCQYCFDYWLTYSSNEKLWDDVEWIFFCENNGIYRPTDFNDYDGGCQLFCNAFEREWLESDDEEELTENFIIPSYIPSTMDLTLKASLASGKALYYRDTTYHIAKPYDTDPDVYDYADMTPVPPEGIRFTNTSKLKKWINTGFYLARATKIEPGDILTLSMSGTIGGRYKSDRGSVSYLITDSTACKPPTGISINDSTVGTQFIEDKVLLKWWGALPGTNNNIAGYRIIYYDSERSGSLSGKTVVYKEIKTIQSSGQLEVPTPQPGLYRYYQVITIGQNAAEELISTPKAAPYVYRRSITKCTAPTSVYVGSTISNDTSNLYFSGAQQGNYNIAKKFEVQRALRIPESSSWTQWEDCTAVPVETLTPKYNFTGNHHVTINSQGIPYIHLNSDGVFTIDQDTLVDVFLVGAGGGGALGCRQSTYASGVSYYYLPASGGGGGYTTNVFKLLLKQGQEYKVVIGQGGKGGYLTEDGITESLQGENGGNTTAFGYEAHGGYGGNCRSEYTHTDNYKGYIGGNGGSAGGSGITINYPGHGAFDGADSLGVERSSVSDPYGFVGAFGQGFTTRSFMEPNDKAYASGGGGVSCGNNSISVGSGGDSTAGQGVKGELTTLPDAMPNSGSGGGARCGRYFYDGIYNLTKTVGGSGGSGIVIIRPSLCCTQVTPHKAERHTYKYRVRLVGEAGPEFASEWTESSNTLTRDLFDFNPFTDNPAEPYTTVVKAAHTAELQDRISSMVDFYANTQCDMPHPISAVTPISEWNSHIQQCQNVFDKMNGIHDEWIPVTSASKPQADILNQLRHVVDQGHKVKTIFNDNDQNPYETVTLAGREVAYKDAIPTAPPEDDVEYIFKGWQYLGGQQQDDALAGVTHNRRIQTNFIAIPRKYTVEFYSGDTLIYQTYVPAGKTPIYQGFPPVRTDIDDPENFEFDKWNHEIAPIYEDTKYYAVFSHALLTETIKDTWEEIMQSVEDGSYVTKYKAGDTKELNLGELGYVNMAIAAIDFDQLSDGSGTAAITWISEQLLPKGVQWHVDKTATWGNCQLRTYLHDNVMPHIPEGIRNNIEAIHDTNDLVWVPSYNEVYGKSAFYYVLFMDDNGKRAKKTLSGIFVDWWLRDVFDSSTGAVRNITTSGGLSSAAPTVLKNMPLCFCTGKTPKREE